MTACDYRAALDVACAAARAAGQLLLEEWHRPNGPRGGDAKAVADTEAEHEIRRRLVGGFPDWRYVGEETGTQDGRPGDPHCWLVDPNDGTIPYLEGYRGSAVAIGLLRDGLPILGVIFSFCYPDDGGDLIAWAEGCGTLQRNGRSIPPPVWPDTLGPYDVVLASQYADRKPDLTLRILAPARYRCVPSIAYRLALVAAGEGVATYSLNGPGDYDYGAAHALLRGAGGELVDETGQPVVYTPQGVSRTRQCFGGAPKVVRELARRPWMDVKQSAPLRGGDFELLRPWPGHNIRSVQQLDRAQGALLGLLAGDALGSQVEFQRPDVIGRMYPDGLRTMRDGGTFNTLAGQPTDDGELALSLARAIIRTGQYDLEAVAQGYAAWINSHPFDCGLTTRKALGPITPADLAHGRAHVRARQSADGDSQANGALMRVAPLAVWGACLPPDRLAQYAADDASLTHPHPVCVDANRVFCAAIARGIQGESAPQAMYEAALSEARTPVVKEALEAARTAAPADYLHQQGWVKLALQNAFYQLLHAKSVEAALVDTVMRGGDTDTNAAIAGALLGALHGRSGIPFDWRQMVLSCRPAVGLERIHRPRPQFLWPVDVRDLSERLLVCGQSSQAAVSMIAVGEALWLLILAILGWGTVWAVLNPGPLPSGGMIFLVIVCDCASVTMLALAARFVRRSPLLSRPSRILLGIVVLGLHLAFMAFGTIQWIFQILASIFNPHHPHLWE